MGYTAEEMRLIKRYEESTDAEVVDFVKTVLSGDERLNYITVAFLSEEASNEIERLTGKKVAGGRVVLDINCIKHINKRHGQNGEQDHSMENIDDIARMGYVIMNYDRITYSGIKTTGYLDEEGKPSPMVCFEKKIDGTYYLVEAVNSSKKKKNYVVSAYIRNKKE